MEGQRESSVSPGAQMSPLNPLPPRGSLSLSLLLLHLDMY